MLNISPVSVQGKIQTENYKTFQNVRSLRTYTSVTRVILIILIIIILILLLPWTQNVQGNGLVTTLQPEHRPQTIQSVISGRVNQWYVREGDFVAKGDTILQIVEIQDAFFDPDLIGRMGEQIKSREGGFDANVSRITALEQQVAAMQRTREIRTEQIKNNIQQARLKIASDSIRVKAAFTELEVARLQLTRAENLLEEGLLSVTDVEGRKIRVQEAEARVISSQNQLLISESELLNSNADLINIQNEFADRIARTNADLFNAITAKFDVNVDLEKMKNQLVNFEMRSQYRHVVSPQDGFIAQALVPGVGENVKEGQPLVSIMPSNYELAVAFWIRPIDLPLIKIGYPVRFIFDGWPAFVFSGWPQTSFGTFGGRIVAIDNFTDENNSYRVLVAPDPDDQKWPIELRVGSGAKGFALLGDVSLWYEVWRQLNGFPPDYYSKSNKSGSDIKRKQPLKSVK